jgi:hypothetical protein
MPAAKVATRRSKSARSLLQTSRRAPSVRYCGTLPVPSGMRGSRSSCAAAGFVPSASIATIVSAASAPILVSTRMAAA